MSASIPIFYTPVIYKNEYYIDGACMDNYPIGMFNSNLDKVIGFYILSNSNTVDNIDNLEQYILRVVCSLIEGSDINCVRAYKKHTLCICFYHMCITFY